MLFIPSCNQSMSRNERQGGRKRILNTCAPTRPKRDNLIQRLQLGMSPNRLLLLGLLTFFAVAACAPYHKLVGNTEKKVVDSAETNITKIQASEAFAKGEYRTAYGLYEKLAEVNPRSADYGFYYAESLRLSGLNDKADSQYNKLIAQDKNNLAAIEGRGLNYLQNGDLAYALEQFNIVIAKDVSRWRTINAIGVIYSISGKDAEATQYYNMALELSNDNPSIINNIALGMAFGGEHDKGIALLKRVLTALPDKDVRKIKLQNNLAMLYGISGHMDEAEAILRKNLPEAAVYNNLGFYAKIAADKQLAWSYLSKAISSSPVYYEKAENNLKGLDAPEVAGEATITEDDSKEIKGKEDNNKTTASVADDSDAPQIAPVKARRGTHRLPLPSLRP